MRQRNLVLILARDLADKLASAAFIVDEEGTLVYFNERCGEIIGMPFSEAGEMTMDRWSTAFRATDFEGRQIEPGNAALAVALREQIPIHQKLRVLTADQQIRSIAVTAMPLFAHKDECVGAMALFWEHIEDGEG
jgi:PAS domain-containing protein